MSSLKMIQKEIGNVESSKKSFKKMVLSKADMKTNFRSIFRCVCQSINWYANFILGFVVEIERNLKSLQKIVKNLLADTETNLLQMSVN